MWFRCALFLLWAAPVAAVEFDFATVLKDVDGVPYRLSCNVVKPAIPDFPGQPGSGKPAECADWSNHTLGLIVYSALNRVPDKLTDNLQAQVEEASRAILARKIYPGTNTTHVVDLSGPEIKLMFDAVVIGAQKLPPVEKVAVLEMIDPVRLKSMLEK